MNQKEAIEQREQFIVANEYMNALQRAKEFSHVVTNLGSVLDSAGRDLVSALASVNVIASLGYSEYNAASLALQLGLTDENGNVPSVRLENSLATLRAMLDELLGKEPTEPKSGDLNPQLPPPE